MYPVEGRKPVDVLCKHSKKTLPIVLIVQYETEQFPPWNDYSTVERLTKLFIDGYCIALPVWILVVFR